MLDSPAHVGKPVDPLPSGSDAAFRALFEQEVVGVGQADTDGRIVSANARLADMLGYAPGELLGLTFDDITHPDSRQESGRKLAFLISGGASYVIEKEFVRKDGDSIWGVANVTAVRDESGGVSSLLAFVVDVTERKRAEHNAAFLDGLSARLGTAREEKEIVRASLQALCQGLHVPRAYFAECNEAESRVLVSGQRGTDPAGSFSQGLSMQQLGGSAWWRAYSRGGT